MTIQLNLDHYYYYSFSRHHASRVGFFYYFLAELVFVALLFVTSWGMDRLFCDLGMMRYNKMYSVYTGWFLTAGCHISWKCGHHTMAESLHYVMFKTHGYYSGSMAAIPF